VNAGRALSIAAAALLVAFLPVRPARPAPLVADSCAASPLPGADSLVATGRFWHALRVLGPLPPRGRPLTVHEAVLRVRVAEGLGRWGQVDSVLARVRGADTVPDLLFAAGRQDERRERWLAAAARYRNLEGHADVRPALRAVAVVRLAVVFEKLGLTDSAEVAWRRAAQALPDLADWFAVHRAALEPDTAMAFAALAVTRSRGAQESADALIASRRLAAGNLRGALALFLRHGNVLDASRVEVQLGHADMARTRIDAMLLADPARPTALLAANFIDEEFPAPTPAELLGIARAYRSRGDLRSAERYLERLTVQRDTSLVAWLELASVTTARHRFPAARDALAHARKLVARSAALTPAVLARAETQLLGGEGRWAEADSLVSRFVVAGAADTSVAAAALLLANHERSDGTPDAEARWYHAIVARFPGPAAAVARYRLALMQVAAGHADSAASDLAAVLAADSAHRLGPGPAYWSARLALARGDSAGAAGLRAIAAGDPTGYYGVRALELLGEELPVGPDSALPPLPAAAFSPTRAADRIRLLVAAGFEPEARVEAVAWIRDTSASVQLLDAAAAAATEAGFAQEAIFLGNAARARAPLTRGTAKALFPLPYRAEITAEADEHCVDPMLLAAIVRQESRFQPRARSRAGARGLSQVLPVTARELSRRLRPWDPELLYVPDFNLHVGARYLHDRLMRDPLPVYALIASYDAGPQHLARWRVWPEFGDMDLFVERLPIAETRDYVRSVYANYAWYRRVYETPPGAGR